MEEKLQELQNKLADEESERKAISISMSEMTDKQSAEKSILIKVCLVTDLKAQNNIRYECWNFQRRFLSISFELLGHGVP